MMGASQLKIGHGPMSSSLALTVDRLRQVSHVILTDRDQADYIVTSQGSVFARYLTYYSAAEVLNVHDVLIGDVPARYRELESRSGRIFMTDDVFRDPEYYRSRGREAPALFAELVSPLRRSRQEVSRSEVGTVFEVKTR